MDGFNSSDLNFSSPEDGGIRRGRRAIASIVERSAVVRIQSKKAVKTLKPVANAPSTAIARQYWNDLFKQYATSTVQIDIRLNKISPPEDAIRFISRPPSHLQSRIKDMKVAWTVIKNAEMQLDRVLTFHYSDYHLSKRDALRIDVTTQKVLNDGEITRYPVREKQWLTG